MTIHARLPSALISLAIACSSTNGDDSAQHDGAGDEASTEAEDPTGAEDSSGTEDPSGAADSTGAEDPTDAEDSTGAPQAECPAPSGGPTMVEDIVSDTTFTADGSPWVIDHGVSVRATLTLDPCAEVLIGAGVTVTVRDEGSIVGIGTEEQPIHIGRLDADAPWSSIRSLHGNPLVLAHTTIEGGGDFGGVHPHYAAMIYAQAIDAGSPDTLDFDHVSVRGSVTQGILLIDGARFSSSSTALVATDNGSYPLNTWANGLSTVPDGDYTGNAVDAIFVVGIGGAEVSEDVTIVDHGVPYVIGNDVSSSQLRVDGGDAATPPILTIAAGVELRFGRDGALLVYGGFPGSVGSALVAIGTPEAPIVFTSDAPAPAAGDWLGVYLWNVPDPLDVITHARVEYAGGISQIGSSACNTDGVGNHDAAIRFLGTGGQVTPESPDGQIVTHTAIVASAGSGIDRGWVGEPIDFLDTNEFEDIAQCLQSYPRPEGESCPDPAPCPME